MKIILKLAFSTALIVSLSACATVESQPERIITPTVSLEKQSEAMSPVAPRLKRRIAVASFSNSTNYGKGLLFDGENDPLADQALDMLVKRLVETNRFLVFERSNLDEMAFERTLLQGGDSSNLIGVEALIIGSVTEFGRKTEGQAGFLSSTKKQTVLATVEARMVDPRTGLAFFSASGEGEASTESGEVAGFGSKAAYDASLNDRAIAAAISNITSEIIGNLEERPWSTDILQVDGNNVYISGGSRQGLQVGDVFNVESQGKVVSSGQSGLPITLPGKKVAEIRVDSFFGDNEYAEGSIATIISGAIPVGAEKNLKVKEVK